MKKKLLFAIIGIFVLLCTPLLPACSRNNYSSCGLRFDLIEDGTAYRVSRGRSRQSDIVIPAEFRGLPVIMISHGGFRDFNDLTSVIIPEGITHIGRMAFLRSSGLTSVQIPSSVTYIYVAAFAGCSGLVNIEVDSNNQTFRSEGNTLIRNEDNTLIFGNQHSIIPNNITVISDDAFFLIELTHLILPNSVIYINESVFGSSKESLKWIVLPTSITYIGTDAFTNSCTVPLTVFYGGASIYDWDLILIEEHNERLLNAVIFFYSQTQPTGDGSFWRFIDGLPVAW